MSRSGIFRIDLQVVDRNLDGTRDRRAILYVPESFGTDRPVVWLAYHGAGSSAEHMVEFCHLNQLADEEGFAVVYPHGSGRTQAAGTWNGGPMCGYAGRQNIDDVGFTQQLIDHLRKNWFDPATCFFPVGMSNGGLMCYRLAEEISHEFVAIGCVAGSMAFSTCSASEPVSIVHFHGTEDDFVPFDGGIGRRSQTRMAFVPVPECIAAWVRNNGCDSQPELEVRDDTCEGYVADGTRIEISRYANGNEESRVKLFKIVGGGHTWPGYPSNLDFLGKTTLNLDVNRELWDFFQACCA